MQDVMEIIIGQHRLRLCSNGIRWWLESDDLESGDTFRHEFRAGSREGIAPIWDNALGLLGSGDYTPRDDAGGIWWLLGHGPE